MQRSPEELAELKAKLVEMRAQGWSTPRMAERLGLTRDQCAGLVNRLIRGYKSPSQHAAAKAAAQQLPFVPPTSGPRPRPSQPVSLEAMPIVKTDLSFEPPEGKTNIWNIRNGQCRWIDEEGFFCATPTGSPSQSYCEHHFKICFVKAPPRIRIKCPNSLPSPSANYA